MTRGYKMESTDPGMAAVVVEALKLWLEANPDNPRAEQARTHITLMEMATILDGADNDNS